LQSGYGGECKAFWHLIPACQQVSGFDMTKFELKPAL
jgi:hypothetical protein